MKRELDERIADWVDGRLSPRELARLEAEFEVNPKLYRAAGEYRKSVEQVRRALAEPEKPVNLADRVWEEIQLQRARPPWGKALPFLASFAAAAAMILLFIALYRVQPWAHRGEFLEVASREAGGAEDSRAEDSRAEDSKTEGSRTEDSRTEDSRTEDRDAEKRMAEGLLARDELSEAERPGAERPGAELVGAENVAPRRADTGDRARRQLSLAEELQRPAQTRAGVGKLDEGVAANRRGNEGAVADKVGALGEGERNLRATPAPGRPTSVVLGPGVPEVGAPSPGATVSGDETLAWLQMVVSDPDHRVAGAALGLEAQKDREQLDLDQALRLLESRAAAGSGTPVVVFNLPAAAGPVTGGPGTGDPAASGDLSRELQELLRRMQGPPVRTEARTLEEDDPRPRPLKNRNLQETLEWALLPMSNVGPPTLEEFDPRSRQTLQNLQSAVGFSDLASQQGYFSRVTVDVPVGVDGRAFRLQGDREQVAQFLRRVSDWGRAVQAVVEIGQVAEEVVRQSRISPRPQVGGLSRAPETEGLSLDARRGGRRGRGPGARYAREQISVLLLFQSGAVAPKKIK